MDVTFRWVSGLNASEEEWNRLDAMLAEHGWASLNRATSRVLVAESNGEMAFIAFQMVPYVGPLYVPRSMRGDGVAVELADKMMTFLIENDTRGWMAVAESPHTAKLCENRGMQRVPAPVYVLPDFGGLEV
jgi:hypothetical protein